MRPRGVWWPSTDHSVFINVHGDESGRFENHASAQVVLRIWKDILWLHDVDEDTMVILTGYNSQKKLCGKSISDDSALRGVVVMTVRLEKACSRGASPPASEKRSPHKSQQTNDAEKRETSEYLRHSMYKSFSHKDDDKNV